MTIVHKTCGDMSFVTFLLIQLVISRKMVKSAKNTICDISAQNFCGDLSFVTFFLIQL